MKRKKGYFSISAVAEMFSVHQQTIRLYEKEGLISPKRSEGNMRLFSDEDINRLEEVIYLTHQLGINLAGVEMIMKLKKQMKKMQKEMNELFEKTQDQLSKETEASKEVIQSSAKQLMKIKKKQTETLSSQPEADQNQTTGSQEHDPENQIFDIDNWKITYDD